MIGQLNESRPPNFNSRYNEISAGGINNTVDSNKAIDTRFGILCRLKVNKGAKEIAVPIDKHKTDKIIKLIYNIKK